MSYPNFFFRPASSELTTTPLRSAVSCRCATQQDRGRCNGLLILAIRVAGKLAPEANSGAFFTIWCRSSALFSLSKSSLHPRNMRVARLLGELT